MIRVLITGVSSVLGEKLVRFASKSGFETYGTYKSNLIDIDNSVHLDLVDRGAVLTVCKNIKPDAIINSAVITDIDLCECEKDLTVVVS